MTDSVMVEFDLISKVVQRYSSVTICFVFTAADPPHRDRVCNGDMRYTSLSLKPPDVTNKCGGKEHESKRVNHLYK